MKHFLSLTFRIAAISSLFLVAACDHIKKIPDTPLGTGYSALELCSRSFISDQPHSVIVDQVLNPKVFPLPYVWDVDIDQENKQVTVAAPLGMYKATAIYREGLGCTMIVDSEVDAVRAQPFYALPEPAVLPADQYWPLGTKGVTPNVPGLNYATLNSVLDGMFAESSDDEFAQQNTFATAVVYKGQLVAERYSEGHDENTPLLSWSMAKTLTAIMVGILHDEGKVELDEPLPSLAATGKNATLRNVLHMSSGIAWSEGYESDSNISRMLYLNGNGEDYVLQQGQAEQPGEVYAYSTGDTQLLSGLVYDIAGGDLQSNYDFYQQRLFHKLGIKALIEHDESGVMIGGARVFMTPRDWAKIGQMMMDKGLWQGDRVVSEEWVDFMLTPSPAADYYGGQVWLNDMDADMPRMPTEAFYLRGYLGQWVGVIPSKQLVVVRQGAYGSRLASEAMAPEFMQHMLDIVKALPHEVPKFIAVPVEGTIEGTIL